jgi:hypothetical protein
MLRPYISHITTLASPMCIVHIARMQTSFLLASSFDKLRAYPERSRRDERDFQHTLLR